MSTVRSLAAETWRRGVYRRINHGMRLFGVEFDGEMDCLRSMVAELRSLRKRLLLERHD